MSRFAKLDRHPFDSSWVRTTVRRWGLALWFLLVSLAAGSSHFTLNPTLFFDAQLYLDATRTWLAGGDPWTVAHGGVLFAAPPPTLVLLVPLALLPGDLGWITLGLGCAAAAGLTVRLLRLPWWWLLFPPTVMAVLSGNVQALPVPLILANSGWVAGVLKVYAIVPDLILGRWRQVLALAAVLAVTAPLLPWAQYIHAFGSVTGALADQTRYGFPATVSLLMAPLAFVAMWIVGRERSAWLAVPALWPSQQWYYATLALPTRSVVACFVVSLPFAGSGMAALLVLAVIELGKQRQDRRRAAVASRSSSPRTR